MEENEKKDEQEKAETEATENNEPLQKELKQETKEEQKKETEEMKKEKTEEKNQAEDTKPEEKVEVKEQKFEKVEEKSKTKGNQGTKSTKKKGPIIAIIVVLVAIVAAIIAFFTLKTKTIDLSECLTVEYKGYSGYATATVTVDETAIKKKIDDSSVAKSFIKKLEIEVENTSNLSNGDEIIVKASISSSFLEENKLKLKEKTIKIKVEGLEEATAIDMSKYIELNYEGFNKHATAEATLKTEELKKDLGTDIYEKIKNRITLTVLDNGTLANGDNVKVQIETSNASYLEENGIKFSSDVVEIPVEGLKDATEVDAFKDITVNITGMSPNLSVTITNNSTDEFLKTVEYSLSKKTGIANGETITITATKWDEELAEEKLVTLKETTKEYTVNGQAAYIFSTSEFTDAVKTEIKAIFVSKATSKASENFARWADNAKCYVRENTDYKYVEIEDIDRDLSAGTPEIASMYLLTKKDDKNVQDINIIVCILKVPFKSAKAGVTYNWYITVKANNASLTTEGKISENTNYTIIAQNGEDEEKAYQAYVNDKKDDYNVEKISL